MVKSLNNAKLDIKNIENASINNNFNGVKTEKVDFELKAEEIDVVSLKKSPCSDRFVDENNNYNLDSLEIIKERECGRALDGTRGELIFKTIDEVIAIIEKLNRLYSRFPGFSYYNQNLYLEPYKYDTIQEEGCCPTCFAMVATYLTGKDVLPTDVIEAFYPYCYEAGTDVTGNCIPDVCSNYGITAKRVDWHDRDAVMNELKAGHPIILNVGRGRFSGTGHFIVLLGIDENGKVIIADPNSVSNSAKTYDIDELLNETFDTESSAWSFEKNN